MKAPKILSALSGIVARQRDVANEFHAALASIRSDIERAQAELASVQAAPPDSAELRERAAEVAAILARQARDRLHAGRLNASDFDAVTFADDIGRSSGVVHGETVNGGAGHFTGTAAISSRLTGLHVLALARADELAALLVAAAETDADPSLTPLSAKKRAADIDRIRRTLDQHERAEEQLCRAAEAGGLVGVERRVDASPKWLLAPDAALADES